MAIKSAGFVFHGLFNGLKQFFRRPVQPRAEFFCRQTVGQFGQPVEVEAFFRDADAELLRVNGIDLLLDMVFHRHEKQRFAQPRGFADGLEAGGADDMAARGHHFQKFLAVELVERQGRRMLEFRRRAGLVVKTVQLRLRILGAPGDDLVGVTVIQQIDKREVAVGVGGQREKLFPQNRRADNNPLSRQIGRFVERERQFRCAGAEQPGVEAHAEQLFPQLRRVDIVGVLEHELVPDGDDRRTFPARQRVKCGDGLEEVEDHVRLRFADDGVELADVAKIFRQVAEDGQQRGGVADGAVVLIFELQRRHLPDGDFHRRCEVFRQRPVRARPDGYGDDLMSRRLGHFLDGHCLSHVTPPLAEHA